MAVEVGVVAIKVRPNLKGFRRETEAQLAGIPDSFDIEARPDFDRFNRDVERAGDGLSFKVVPDLDEPKFKKKLSRLTSGQPMKLGVALDTSKLESEAAKVSERVSGRRVKFDAAVELARGEFGRLQRHVKRQVHGRAVGFQVKLDYKVSQASDVVRSQARSVAKQMQEAVAKASSRTRDGLLDGYKNKLKPAFFKGVNRSISQVSRTIYAAVGPMHEYLSMTKRAAEYEGHKQNVKNLRDELELLAKINSRRHSPKRRGNKTDFKTFSPEFEFLRRAELRMRDLQGSDDIRKAYRAIEQSMRRIQASSSELSDSFDKVRESFKVPEEREFVRAGRRFDAVREKLRKFRHENETLQRLQFRARQRKHKLVSAFEWYKEDIPRLGRELADKVSSVQQRVQQKVRDKVSRLNRRRDVPKPTHHIIDGGLPDVLDRTSRAADKADFSLKKLFKTNKQGSGVVKHTGRKFLGLSRVGWIVAAVAAVTAPAVQLVSGAVAALPALGAAAGVALGALVLGFDGVKKAANAMNPSIEKAEHALGNIFESRLTPQFEQLNKAMFGWIPGLEKVAHGMSDMSQGFVDAVTSAKGMRQMNNILNNTAGLFRGLKPFTKDFTEGMLELASVGSKTFPKLEEGLNRFGASFKNGVQELADNGKLQRAIEQTYDVLGAAGRGIGKIFQAGLESFTPEAARAYSDALLSFGDAVARVLPSFTQLSTGVFDFGAGLFDGIASLVEGVGPGAGAVLKDLGSGLGDLASAVGELAGVSLGPLFDDLAQISPGISDVLSGVASGVQEFSSALEKLNGSSTSLDKLRETSNELPSISESFSDMGVSFGDAVADIVDDLGRLETGLGLDFETKLQNEIDLSRLREAGVSINDFMGTWDRMVSLGLNSQNVEMVIDVSLRKLEGDNLQEQINDTVQELEALSKATKINLDPQIEIAKNATSADQLSQLGNQVADAFTNGTLGPPVEIEVPVDVKPKVNPENMLSDGKTLYGPGITDAYRQWAEQQAAAAAPQVTEGFEQGLGDNISPTAKGMAGLVSKFRDSFANLFSEDSAGFSGITQALGTQLSQAMNDVNFEGADFTPLSDKMATQFASMEFSEEATSGFSGKLAELMNSANFEEVPLDGLSTSIASSLGSLEFPEESLAGFNQSMAGVLNNVSFDEIPMDGLSTSIASSMANLQFPEESLAGINTMFGNALNNISLDQVPLEGLSASIANSLSSLQFPVEAMAGFGAKIGEALNSVDLGAIDLSSLSTGISTALSNIDVNADGLGTKIAEGLSQAQGAVEAAARALGEAAKSAVASVDLTGEGTRVGSTFGQGMMGAQGVTTAAAAALGQAAVGATAGISLFANGAAAGQSFAAGISSARGAVAAAAASLASAVKQYMPHSPAKKGPLSGKGYTDESGMALAKDFAAGIRQFADDPAKATHDMVKGVQDEVERINIKRVEAPVREANAKKIARALENHDKRIKEAHEKHAERTAEWQKKGSKGKAPEYKDPEFELPELDEVDYEKMDRSVKNYWVGAFEDSLRDNMNSFIDNEAVGIFKDAHRQLTEQFGSNPLLDHIGAELDNPNMPRRLKKVLEDAGIAELPVKVVISNIDQLKSDLGMGDGVASRAIDVAYEFNPSNSDHNIEKDWESPVNYNFYVLNVDEAMRIKEVQDKKRFMKEGK